MKVETGIEKSVDGKDPNRNGKIATIAVTLGTIGLLAVGKWAINRNPDTIYSKTVEESNQDEDTISFAETENLRLIYVTNSVNNNIIPYVIRRESYFIEDKEKYIDIFTEVPLFDVNDSGEIINSNNLSFEDHGSLSEYYISNNLVQSEYKKEEIKSAIESAKEDIEKQRKNNQFTK